MNNMKTTLSFLLPVLESLRPSLLLNPIRTALLQAPLAGDTLQYPEETHFKNIQQLTFGGDNAEAYFSSVMVSTSYSNAPMPKNGLACDQMFMGKVACRRRKV